MIKKEDELGIEIDTELTGLNESRKRGLREIRGKSIDAMHAEENVDALETNPFD